MTGKAFRAVILTLVCSLGLAFGSSGQVAAATPGDYAPQRTSVQSDLVSLVNGYRAANGLGPVGMNGALSSAATWMASDMAAKSYFSHTSSDGRSPQQRMAAFGYPAYTLYTGENIAAGQASAADVVAGWKASPAHNAILLSANFNAVGVGYAYSATSTFKSYWVADFGGPGGNVAPAPAPVVAPAPVAVTPALTIAATVPVSPAPASADLTAAVSPSAAEADQTAPSPSEKPRAVAVPRGETRSGDPDAVTLTVSDGFAMRRLLHLLVVLERLDHPH